jgi:hypothetical protein
MNRKLEIVACLGMVLLLQASAVLAGEADIVGVEVKRVGDETYSFEVSVRHADQGWEHYADRWEILALDGSKLGVRVLLHPHDHEQPFTRGLSRVRIPSAIKEVVLRAHDSSHGYGGREFKLTLP